MKSKSKLRNIGIQFFANVPTDTGTYLADLFDPQVVADLIQDSLIPKIVFAPLATVDYTLQGTAGSTAVLPYYEYIGDAEEVPEGTDIPIEKLSQKTKEVKIIKVGKGVQLTDEAVLSGYGDPIGEGVNQITNSIASKADGLLLGALDGNTKNVYTPSGKFGVDDIPKALALFGENIEGQKAIAVDPELYAELLNVKSWVPASDIAADMLIRGSVGMAYGVQIIVSERVKDNYHIVKPGALGLFIKRDTLVEFDRDIINQSTVMAGSKLFAPYLMNPSKAIKIVANGSSV